MAWSKAIDFHALSWGVPRKPAYNVAETTQRKSQKCMINSYSMNESYMNPSLDNPKY